MAGRHLGFDRTGNSTVLSAIPQKPTLEPNTKWIGWCVTELWPFGKFEIFQSVWMGPEVDRRSLVIDRQYSYFLHWSLLLH